MSTPAWRVRATYREDESPVTDRHHLELALWTIFRSNLEVDPLVSDEGLWLIDLPPALADSLHNSMIYGQGFDITFGSPETPTVSGILIQIEADPR